MLHSLVQLMTNLYQLTHLIVLPLLHRQIRQLAPSFAMTTKVKEKLFKGKD